MLNDVYMVFKAAYYNGFYNLANLCDVKMMDLPWSLRDEIIFQNFRLLTGSTPVVGYQLIYRYTIYAIYIYLQFDGLSCS